MSKPEPCLPPGFRFHPTDEELILHYLRNRAASTPCPVSIIAEVNIYKFDPWELPAKAAFGEKEWYFFSPRDRKYPNGDRPNRTAASGYWKATGTDKLIKATGTTENIGVKKALVFYQGRPPKGLKTNWIMHEYRLVEANNNKRKSNDRSMRLDDWVLCRIYMKSHSLPAIRTPDGEQEDPIQNTAISTFPNIPHQGTLEYHQPSSSIPLSPANFPFLTRFLFDDPSESTLSEFGPVFTNGTINNSYIFPKLSEQEPFVLEMEDQLKDLQSMVWIFGDGV